VVQRVSDKIELQQSLGDGPLRELLERIEQEQSPQRLLDLAVELQRQLLLRRQRKADLEE
jgi:hypothetical protein